MNILKLFLPTIAVFLCSLTSSANPISDLNTYKEAAQAAVSEGDLGRAGVLNFKIGLLYQNNFVNYTAAIEQYRIALGYFEAAGLTDYIIKTHLALADILLCDSVNLAIPHITACLTMAKAASDHTNCVSAINLLIEAYIVQGNYRTAANYADHILQHTADNPHPSNTDTETLNCIYDNLARSFLHLGKPDSARIIASKISINDVTDSINLYSILSTAAQMDNDWKNAMRYKINANRLTDSINYNAYLNQLLVLEKENASNIIQSELQKKKIHNLIISVVFLSVALALLTGIIVLRNMLGKYKERVRQEEDNITHLNKMLSTQLSANHELIRQIGKTNGIIDGIADNMFRYESNPDLVSRNVLLLTSEYISGESSLQRAETIMNAIYPGLLQQIYGDSTKLTDTDKRIIALTACGYSTGALCAMLKITENHLNVKKLRIARKLNVKGSLTKYIKEKVNSFCS